MNKQELVEEIKKHAIYHCGEKECYKEGCTQVVDLKLILEIVNQLDEPQKVKIPQFVADWLSNLKSGLFGLNYDSVSSKIYDWVYATEDNLGKLHLAFVYGYEVEEEKRYQVKFVQTGQHLAKNIYSSGEYFVIKTSTINSTDSFTREELEKADFDWVFDCPGIEIKEVSDESKI